MYLLNAFSLQMLDKFPSELKIEEVKKLPPGLESAIGHADTAEALGVPMKRISVVIRGGEVAYVAQITGGRLPEKTVTLPSGTRLRYFKVTVK